MKQNAKLRQEELCFFSAIREAMSKAKVFTYSCLLAAGKEFSSLHFVGVFVFSQTLMHWVMFILTHKESCKGMLQHNVHFTLSAWGGVGGGVKEQTDLILCVEVAFFGTFDGCAVSHAMIHDVVKSGTVASTSWLYLNGCRSSELLMVV